jgi:hypothetical protein
MRKLINAKIWVGMCLAAFLAPATYGACTYSLSKNHEEHGNGRVTNSFTVNTGTGCVWSVTSKPSWITIQSGASGTNTGAVTYVVTNNFDSISRTGVVTIAGLPFTVTQDGAPCNYDISPSTRLNHGNGASLLNSIAITVEASNCTWTVINTNTWFSFNQPTNGVGDGTVYYNLLANHTPVRRTGNVLIAEQLFILAQNKASCLYEMFYVNTAQTNHLFIHQGSLGTNSVSTIPANNGCEWYVENTNSWITITTNQAGTNGGTFVYNVAPNPNSWQRTGFLTLWGGEAIFAVEQKAAPCSNGFSIYPSSAEPEPEPETNTVDLTAVGGCTWSVVNTNGWITILSPTNNTNSGIVKWAVDLNPNSIWRTGVVVIATKNFTVRQEPAICTYELSPTSRKHGYAAKATNLVSIETLSICPWNIVNTNSWITFYEPTNGIGDSTNITYAILANPASGSRTGLVFIGGQSLVLTQLGVNCAINLSPTHHDHGYGLATSAFSVNIATNCSWVVSNSNPWIQITTNSSGTGSTSFGYIVSPNPNSSPRTGYIYVEEGTVSIFQDGAPCKVPLTPTSATHTPLQETGAVVVASPGGCNWSAVTTNPWVTILSGTNGTGIDVVSYRVDANANGGARSGRITVTGLAGTNNFSIDQDGVTCAYRLSPVSRKHGPGAVLFDTFKVLVSNACPWIVENTNLWIHILTNSTGSGSNQVTYSVDANSLTPFERIGALVVQGQSLVITQRGITCGYSVSPKSVKHGYGATSNSFSVITTNGCAWAVSNTIPWIIITSNGTGTATGPVGYLVEENPNLTDRIGALTVEGQTYTITQLAATCSISLSSTNRNHGYAATNNSVDVDTAAGCVWPVSTPDSWIQILSGSPGTGTGTVSYAVLSNLNLTPRDGSIQIGNRTLTLHQAAFDCNYKLSPTSRSHGFGATSSTTTNSVVITNVTPGCTWSVNNTNDWIIITSGLSGTGNSNFTYTVGANSGTTTRTGYVVVEDQVLTLTQGISTNGFRFEAVIPGPSGEIILKLNGGPPGIWELHSSPDLVTWTKFANITNITGRVEYILPSTGGTNRFFQAKLP